MFLPEPKSKALLVFSEACWRKCGEMRPVEPEANARQLEALTPPAAAGQNHVANGDVELQVY